MYKILTCLLLLFFANPVFSEEGEKQEPINTATLIGIGGYNLMDTYLTPGSRIPYTGWGIRVMNERMKMTRLADHRISRQQVFNADIASTQNGAGTTQAFSGFLDYTLGYHYHFNPIPALKLLAGASVHAMGGFIYCVRSSNNPASAKADLDLNLSAQAIYNFRIRNYPLTLRYQMEIPFIGILFSPHYGQSYYEIFDRGNKSGIVPFTSFHNKQAMKNYVTIDFSIGKFTFRAGYMNSLYYLDVNQIQSYIRSHSFVIGFVREFISFGGRKMQQESKHNSVFY